MDRYRVSNRYFFITRRVSEDNEQNVAELVRVQENLQARLRKSDDFHYEGFTSLTLRVRITKTE